MSLDWSPLLDVVHRQSRFLLTTHVRPDADGLGSMLALAEVLRQHGKRVQMVVASGLSQNGTAKIPVVRQAMPARYHFLDPERSVEFFEPPGAAYRTAEAVIVLDTGTWNQLGSFAPFCKELGADKLVIDHHLTQDDLGAVRLVDTTAEATGRLVYEAVKALGGPITASMANRLFAALAMDTGWFRHSNVRPATFGLAQELMAAGAEPGHLYQQLFEENTLGRLKLMGRVLDRLTVTHQGRTAYSEVRLDDYAATGATPPDTEDMVNLGRSVIGIEVGLFFMEQPRGGVKISFRSLERVDVARIAEQFGGGGHRLASGAIVEAPLDEVRRKVLDAVAASLAAL